MTLLIRQIISLIQLLHSENGTAQIAWGLVLGLFLGFSPLLSLQAMFVLLILLFFRIQFGAAFLSAFFFKFIAFLIDPAADALGRWVLEMDGLRPLWTKMYNVPLLPYTRFNNSIVMGSFLVALILAPLFYFLFTKLIIKYRTHIVHRFEQTRLWKSLKATKAYDYYRKYDDLYGSH